MTATSRSVLIGTLAIAGAAAGYFLPIVGPILVVVLVLLIISAVVDEGGGLADLVLTPFSALLLWLRQPDENRWVRRSPVLGLITGSIGRWVYNGMLGGV